MVALMKQTSVVNAPVYDVRVYFECLKMWYSLHLVGDPEEAQLIADAYILEGKQAEAVKREVY